MPVSPAGAVDLAKGMGELYQDAELRLLRIIGRRLSKGMDAPAWAERQLLGIQAARAESAAFLVELQDAADEQARAVITAAYNRGVALAGEDIAGVARTAAASFGGVDRDAVAALLRTTSEALARTGLTILSQQEAAYRDVIQQSSARMLTGTATRREATWEALQTWADRGITGFVDRSGRRWDMTSYAEMATRTSGAQAIVQGHTDRLVDAGRDLVMVSDAPEECERCRPWEGRVLSLTGVTKRGSYVTADGSSYSVAGTLAEATAAGLFHPNCRHRTGIYLPGITPPLTDTADPEGDKLRQAQRAKERRVRPRKRRAEAAEAFGGKGSPEALAARRQARAANADLKAWNEANDRKQLDYRVSTRLPTPQRVNTEAPIPSTPVPTPRKVPGMVSTEDQRVRNAALVFGNGSAQHQAAIARFTPDSSPPVKPRRTPRAVPADVLDRNTRELRVTPDAELDVALGRAFELDHPSADRIMAEIDRRQMAPVLEAERRARRAEAKAARKAADQEAQWAEVGRRIELGEDPRSAVADVTGVSIERQLRAEAFARLKETGSRGRTLDEMIRNDYRDEVYRQWQAAEDATRGQMLSREAEGINARAARLGHGREIDARKLFTGPEKTARKYASDELKAWWDVHGRPTLDDYRYQVIQGTADKRRQDDFLT